MIKGIIFDKDGTLFDFNATWGMWTQNILTDEAGDDPAMFARLADVLGYDPDTQQFRPGSIVVAATAGEIATAIRAIIPAQNNTGLLARMNAAAAKADQVEATPLRPYFESLRALGLRLGVATNDAEAPAQKHLTRAGVIDMLDFVAGYDSGYGGKPDAGQLLAFCAQTGLHPEECIMVGDSTHDLHAGYAAGMRTIGVLTGPAQIDELAPFASVVLPTIADIPAWLKSENLL